MLHQQKPWHLVSAEANFSDWFSYKICAIFFLLGDLWGPLILCILLATLLHSSDNEGAPEFAQVFAIVWIGASVVTLNSKLLGGLM